MNSYGPMEVMAVLAMRPEFAEKATEEDAQDIFEVGAEFVPEAALHVLAHRYPGVTFRHAADVLAVYPEILKSVARANAERALASGLSAHLEQGRARTLLRDDPRRLKYIPAEDRDRLVDTPFAEELSTLDPISVLRFAKQFLTRGTLEDIAEKAFVENARAQGFDAVQWSAFRLPENRLANCNLRFFTCPLGQLGQGWTTALSVERTNLREASRHHGISDFLVQAVQYSFDNVTEDQAEALARNCVLSWDFLQVQLDIGVLADWHYSSTYKGGCYFWMAGFELSHESPILLPASTSVAE